MASSVAFESFSEVAQIYEPSANTTPNIMTKYEKTKIIGMRLEQLARGAPPCIDVVDGMTIRDIVLKELDERKTPFLIVRSMANGKKEYFKLVDMIVA